MGSSELMALVATVVVSGAIWLVTVRSMIEKCLLRNLLSIVIKSHLSAFVLLISLGLFVCLFSLAIGLGLDALSSEFSTQQIRRSAIMALFVWLVLSAVLGMWLLIRFQKKSK